MMRFTIKEKVQGKKCANAADIYRTMRGLSKADQESFWAFGFSFYRKERCEIFRECISLGGMHWVFTDNKILFRRLLIAGADSWIALHNHPNEWCHPSEKDKEHAGILERVSNLLQLHFLDYMIVAGEKYYSFHENGLLNDQKCLL
ncbi:MAG: hypothetical protein JRF53_19410 [Deltaproteobacteria bacterium]|nr:hypothetical protein [Deltaproteobacteria bacterium]